jgi:hypothetical protein
MPVGFCTFTDTDGKSVIVNPQQVRCVRPNYETESRIEFDHHHSVLVKGTVEEVERALMLGQINPSLASG